MKAAYNKKTILICDLIAREWQKSYEITQINGYCSNKRKSPYTTIVSMIAYGDGPSGETRTRGILVPNQAPYQLGHTRIQCVSYTIFFKSARGNIPASRRGQLVTNPVGEPGPLGGQPGDGARMDRAYMHWIGGGRSSSPAQRLHKGFQAQQQAHGGKAQAGVQVQVDQVK